jgi:hypothetical protein
MYIGEVKTTDVAGGQRRLSVTVRYDDGGVEDYWFETPESIPVTDSGNPWLALLLPLAATTGEDIRMEPSVDSYLMQNAEALLKLWSAWFPGKTKKIQIRASVTPATGPVPAVLSTFTAGVDAFFTVLRHPECKHYLNVLGLDMPLSKADAFERHFARLTSVARELGAEMIPLTTNLRETRWGQLPWETFASGAALGSCLLIFERRFGTALLPSSFDYRTLMPWGTHPLSDPMYSTSGMRILHDGASHSRNEKTEYIVGHKVVLDNLHVCFQGEDGSGQDDSNCCRCSKCYRTMVVLDILGKLKDCPMFDLSRYSVEQIARLDTTSAVAQSFFLDTRALAVEHGRLDIVESIDRSLARSRWVKKFDRLAGKPFLWRLPYSLRRRAFQGFVTLDLKR